MEIEIRQDLHLKQQQQLVLTPQLKQAIKLLQLSKIELLEVIKEEIKTNPVLEEKDPYTSEESSEAELDLSETESISDDIGDIGWDAYFEEYQDEYWYDKSRFINPGKVELPSFENTTASKADLFSHLMWQLNISGLDEEKKRIGTCIIGNLNKNGYLEASVQEIANLCNTTVEKVEETLRIIQNFDPVGVAARNLQECLLIQARAYNLGGTLVEKIIMNHLEDVEYRRYEKIAQSLSVTIEDVISAVTVIRSLDPRPGSEFFDERTIYIVPDVYVIKVGDEYEVVLNQEDIPMLRINPYYKELLKRKDLLSKKDKAYLRKKLNSAIWLIKSIHQRQATIYKVTKSIVKFQRDFLEYGISHLKPLVLKDVATDIGMSESTVSRITTNKYVHTPQGIFELKFFFTNSINSADGNTISSESVKEYIRRIIKKEDKRKPYSDEEIKQILEKEYNIKIARRTVAKYREELGILSSKKRKI